MYFLHTIEEGQESEELQKSAGEGQNETEGLRKSRHETDSEAYKAATAYSEKQPISQDKHSERKSSSGLSPVAAKDLRRSSDKANERLSASPERNSGRRRFLTQKKAERGSSSASRSPKRMNTSTPRSSRGGSLPVPGRSRRRSSEPPSSSAPCDVQRHGSAGLLSRPGVGTSDAQEDNLPAPQWVINLMLDIEEATRHELTVE